MGISQANSVDSPAAAALTVPVHFGTADRQLFGCLHRPAGPWSGARVVLCTPLGYEGQFSFRTFRELAVHLTDSAGAVVLRFDYDGCGDSAGSDEDPQRVPRWLASIDSAIDEVRRQAPGDGPVVLIGLRAGALLAATAAAARRDVQAVVLWAPSRNGRTFLREQRAFSSMAYVTATAGGAENERWGEQGFEANGYVFTDETVAALEALDLKTLDGPPAPNVLVIDRAEMPVKGLVPESWRAAGAQVEHLVLPGYTELMAPPWLAQRATAATTAMIEWLKRLPSSAQPAGPVQQPETSSGLIAPGVVETAAWYDDARRRFGILTEAVGQPRKHALILITSTFGYRVGPNRMNVAAARHLAPLGIATLRIDLAGVGEVRATPALANTPTPNAPYHLDAIEDVRMAIAYLQRCGYEQVALSGICAGAFLAWHTAAEVGGASQVVLVNPETFVPIRFELEDHLQTEHAPPKWIERLRRERNPFGKLKLIGGRGLRAAAIGFQHLRARLPVALNGSLAARIHALGRQRSRTSIIFSGGDPGITEFRREMGPKAAQFERQGFLRQIFIDGPDHSFTPRWATRLLIDSLASELQRWQRESPVPQGAVNPSASHRAPQRRIP